MGEGLGAAYCLVLTDFFGDSALAICGFTGEAGFSFFLADLSTVLDLETRSDFLDTGATIAFFYGLEAFFVDLTGDTPFIGDALLPLAGDLEGETGLAVLERLVSGRLIRPRGAPDSTKVLNPSVPVAAGCASTAAAPLALSLLRALLGLSSTLGALTGDSGLAALTGEAFFCAFCGDLDLDLDGDAVGFLAGLGLD